MKKPVINIYGCGGCGTNIVKMLKEVMLKDFDFLPTVNLFFVDTSMSNLHDVKGIENNFHIVEGSKNGSGKLRSNNYESISESVKPIITKFKPGDFNIIVNSLGGGTGSTAGPVIHSELLKRNISVLSIAVGSYTSRKETENSLNTILSYEGIANNTKKPTVVIFRENKGRSETEINKEIRATIIGLLSLFSSENEALDTEDIVNFLNFPLVTSYAPSLTSLEIFHGNVAPDFGKGSSPIAMITLAHRDENIEIPDFFVEYQSTGYVLKELEEETKMVVPLRFVIYSGTFLHYHSMINDTLNKFKEARDAVIEKPLGSESIEKTKEGLIL